METETDLQWGIKNFLEYSDDKNKWKSTQVLFKVTNELTFKAHHINRRIFII